MEMATVSHLYIKGEPYVHEQILNLVPEKTVLKIQFSPYGIEYMLIDHSSRQLLYLQPYQNAGTKNYPSKFAEAILHDDIILAKPFLEVHAAVSNISFSIFPREFAGKELINDWYEKFAVSGDDLEIFNSHLEDIDAELVYTVSNSLLNDIKSTFGNFTLSHSVTKQITELSNYSSDKTVYCNVHSNYMQLIVLRDRKLMFANIFLYQTPEDFGYYLLATYKQLHLDPESVPIVLSGEIMKQSQIYQIMFKYIRHINFIKPPGAMKFHSDYPFPAHFYFSLFCL